MAELKDTVINGDLRIVGNLLSTIPIKQNDTTSQTYEFNDFTETGIYNIYPNGSCSHGSDANDRITLIVINHNGRIRQISLGYWLKIRGRTTGGTWNSWAQIGTTSGTDTHF